MRIDTQTNLAQLIIFEIILLVQHEILIVIAFCPYIEANQEICVRRGTTSMIVPYCAASSPSRTKYAKISSSCSFAKALKHHNKSCTFSFPFLKSVFCFSHNHFYHSLSGNIYVLCEAHSKLHPFLLSNE